MKVGWAVERFRITQNLCELLILIPLAAITSRTVSILLINYDSHKF
jgi:hypothetical protein